MSARLSCMTLRELLQQHGVTSIKEFARRMEFSRQQAWDLWHARAGVGRDMLKRLHERLQLPLEELIQIDPISPPKPRGSRARKPRDEEAQ
jgi:transcriptional regulator with XRE-family HTH domain